MFKCILCNEEFVLTSYFCDDCNYIKRILQCYGRNEIKDIITKTCIRNKKQMGNKVEIIKEKLDKEEKKEIVNDDTSYLPCPKINNKEMLKELKKKLEK